ncbi:MAG: hypothetical protein HY848_21220 [Betaproteobacteria bacterium]|nr:hypothetical protein [Betaproteobacteria bacterium]
MAIRIRSHFHREGRERSAAELASVIAMLGWKLSQDAIRRMRAARFDIDIGRQYFDFVCEYLAFMLHAADRVAYRALDAGKRSEFTTALALKLAEVVEDNRDMLVAEPEPGRCRRHFIALANLRGADYADFAYEEKEGPDFGFRRFFGSRLLDIVPQKDHAWVIDQIMEIEAPEAVKALERTLAGLFAPAGEARRPRREGNVGE